jgi:hypothetical protein
MPAAEAIKACFALDTTLNATIGDYLVKLGRLDFLAKEPSTMAGLPLVNTGDLVAKLDDITARLDAVDERIKRIAQAIAARVKLDELNDQVRKSAAMEKMREKLAVVESKIRALERAPAGGTAIPRGGSAVSGAAQGRGRAKARARPASKDDDLDKLLG